ncbi:MAG: hypothetical protein ACXW25_01430 [Rhodospirillales bacterium]
MHLKTSTQKEYRRSLKKFILPFLGNRPIAEVSREEVARFHYKYRHVPYQANRCLEILSKMFNLAELGAQAGRLQPAQAHQEVSRGEARAVSQRRRIAPRRRRLARDGDGRPRAAVGDCGGDAADPHRLPAERDHDAEMGVRRSRRRCPQSPGFEDRCQDRLSRQAGDRHVVPPPLACP